MCHEDLSHQRADDAPPYFTIVVVGHVVVPLMAAVFFATELSVMTHMMIWLPLTLVMTLALLHPIKGALIGAAVGALHARLRYALRPGCDAGRATSAATRR